MHAVTYAQQQWTQIIPFYFKVLIIINLLSFKTHLHYLSKQQPTPACIKRLLLSLYSLATIMLLLVPLIESNPAIPDKVADPFVIVVMSVFLIPLSIASMYALFKLNHGCFQAEQFKNIRIKMFWLEVLIQFVIYSRIMIGWIY